MFEFGLFGIFLGDDFWVYLVINIFLKGLVKFKGKGI